MAKLKITNKVRRTVPSIDDIGPNVVPVMSLQEVTEGQGAPEPYRRVDGRSMRRTGRTIQFGTRVSPTFDARLREIAKRDGISLAEVLERALLVYDTQTSSN